MKRIYHLVNAYYGTVTESLTLEGHQVETRKKARAWLMSKLAVDGYRTLSAVEQSAGIDAAAILETARYVAGDETADELAPVLTESLYE